MLLKSACTTEDDGTGTCVKTQKVRDSSALSARQVTFVARSAVVTTQAVGVISFVAEQCCFLGSCAMYKAQPFLSNSNLAYVMLWGYRTHNFEICMPSSFFSFFI